MHHQHATSKDVSRHFMTLVQAVGFLMERLILYCLDNNENIQ